VIEVCTAGVYCGVETLNDAFIILDEAQNTTGRTDEDVLDPLGAFGSKVVVTRRHHAGGSARRRNFRACGAVMQILDGIDDIHFAELTQRRRRAPNPLVAEIVDGLRPNPRNRR